MNLGEFIDIVTRRWWVIAITTVLAACSAWGYAHHQQRVYQASATVFAHPSNMVVKPADYNGDVGLLTYGTIANTFASLAQSRNLMGQAGAQAHVAAPVLDQYTAVATTVPGTTVIQISVQGPEPRQAADLANALVRRVGSATDRYFRDITLTPLDDAVAPRTPIRPRTLQDVLLGGLAGLIAGFILAALSLRLPASAPVAPWSYAVPANRNGRGDATHDELGSIDEEPATL